MTAVSIFFVYKNVGLSLELIPTLLLTILLVISVLTDIREQLILDIVTLPMLGILIIVRLFIGTEPFWYYLLGGAVDSYYYYSLQLSVKEAWVGEILNYMQPLVLSLGPLSLSSVSSLRPLLEQLLDFLLMTGKVKKGQPIAFGPSIFVGTLIAYVYGSIF